MKHLLEEYRSRANGALITIRLMTFQDLFFNRGRKCIYSGIN